MREHLIKVPFREKPEKHCENLEWRSKYCRKRVDL